VKFRRARPSGQTFPATQFFGDLLADFNKVRAAAASARVVILVTDPPGRNYLEKSGRGLLPLSEKTPRRITVADVDRLPPQTTP
jgi:hypothetical protein